MGGRASCAAARLTSAPRRHPEYDPSTLYIPPGWFKAAKVSEGQRQWCGPASAPRVLAGTRRRLPGLLQGTPAARPPPDE